MAASSRDLFNETSPDAGRIFINATNINTNGIRGYAENYTTDMDTHMLITSAQQSLVGYIPPVSLWKPKPDGGMNRFVPSGTR